jgi:hypothetical protein
MFYRLCHLVEKYNDSVGWDIRAGDSGLISTHLDIENYNTLSFCISLRLG